jgi:hypothetical protein
MINHQNEKKGSGLAPESWRGHAVSKGTWRPGNNPAIYTVFYTSEIDKLNTEILTTHRAKICSTPVSRTTLYTSQMLEKPSG